MALEWYFYWSEFLQCGKRLRPQRILMQHFFFFTFLQKNRDFSIFNKKIKNTIKRRKQDVKNSKPYTLSCFRHLLFDHNFSFSYIILYTLIYVGRSWAAQMIRQLPVCELASLVNDEKEQRSSDIAK